MVCSTYFFTLPLANQRLHSKYKFLQISPLLSILVMVLQSRGKTLDDTAYFPQNTVVLRGMVLQGKLNRLQVKKIRYLAQRNGLIPILSRHLCPGDVLNFYRIHRYMR
jgi:hypothetical protein